MLEARYWRGRGLGSVSVIPVRSLLEAVDHLLDRVPIEHHRAPIPEPEAVACLDPPEVGGQKAAKRARGRRPPVATISLDCAR